MDEIWFWKRCTLWRQLIVQIFMDREIRTIMLGLSFLSGVILFLKSMLKFNRNVNFTGLDYSLVPSKVEATPEFHRALSLLSTDSWGSCEPQSISFEQPMHANHTSMPQSVLHTVPQSSPLASSEYWRTEQQPNDPQVHTLSSRTDGSNYLQEFQLLRTSNGNDFYSSHMNWLLKWFIIFILTN
jgi:hypothetical protein